MSSHWLCAVPRALDARRVGPSLAFLAAFSGLAAASGCGVSTNAGTGGPSSSSGSDGSGAVADAGGAPDAASSCHASDVQTYVPSGVYQAATDPSGACLGTDGAQSLYETFYDLCLGPNKSKSACSVFEQAPASAACASCVLTPYTATRLGPILDYGGFVGGNVPGCIELTEPAPNNISCARNLQALSDCELAACEANCPVSDSASLAAREQCATAADQTGCASYYSSDASSSCFTVASDGGASICMDATFKDFYEAVVPLFCAQTAPDAGAPLDAGAPAADASLLDAGAVDAGSLLPEHDAAAADAKAAVADAARD